MIYEYKGKRVIAENYKEASKLFKISEDLCKSEAKIVRFVLKSEKEVEDYENDEYNDGVKSTLYADKLAKMHGQIDGNSYQKRVVAMLKDNPCAICGQELIARALCFHHCNSQEKKFEIRVGKIRFTHLQEELAKTVLICLNCHSYVHWVEEMPNAGDRKKAMQELYDKWN